MINNTDHSLWGEQQWDFKTSNVPVDTIEAIDIGFEIKSQDVDNIGGGLEFQTGSKIRFIDQSMHLSLLEENIEEHKDIWRELAGK